MLEIDMTQMIEQASNFENLADEEILDLFCEIGAIIGVLGSRDVILMNISGKSQYNESVEKLMACQTLLFPHVIQAAIRLADVTDGWQKHTGNFSMN